MPYFGRQGGFCPIEAGFLVHCPLTLIKMHVILGANVHQVCICTHQKFSTNKMDEGYHELLAQVASMYYEQDMTQNEIVAELGLSRVKIYRLLKQAKAKQVVQIKIDWPATRAKSLEEAVRQRFGLKEALVLQTTYRHHTPLLQRLGQLGARYLERIRQDGMTLAICLGSSTYHVVNSISPTFRAKIQVTEVMGCTPRLSRYSA